MPGVRVSADRRAHGASPDGGDRVGRRSTPRSGGHHPDDGAPASRPGSWASTCTRSTRLPRRRRFSRRRPRARARVFFEHDNGTAGRSHHRARMENGPSNDRHHRRQRPVRHGRADRTAEERPIRTPFGDPSGPYVVGTLRGRRVAFLPRHGLGHRLLPSELNFRANIYGFKVLGVERILFGERRRQPERGVQAARHPGSRSVLRSHEGPHQHVLRPRPRRARRVRAPGVRRLSAHRGRCGAGGRRDRAPRRHLREHGRAAVLDAGRVERSTARGAWTSSG